MNEPIPVELSWDELERAATVGVRRQIQNRDNGARQRYGADPDDWTIAIDGAIGEAVVAKSTGKYWSGSLGDYKADDVGRFQVRMTRREDGCLILHDEDEGDVGTKVFVLVTGGARVRKGCFAYHIRGWIVCNDGRANRKKTDPTKKGRPAYFVPQNVLHDPRTLDV